MAVNPYGINNQYIKSGGMNTHICYHTDAAVHPWMLMTLMLRTTTISSTTVGPTGEPLCFIDIWATVCETNGHRIWQWYEVDGGKGDE
jgi:hypothetical protein